MKAAELAKIVDRHKKFIQDVKVFLTARDGKLVVSSSNAVGAALRSVVKSDAKLDACVASESLLALLKATGDVSLSVADGRLVVRGNKMRGDIPIDAAFQAPVLPKTDKVQPISEADVRTLIDVLPRVEIPRLERSGQLSIRVKDGELYVACADELHGALYYGKGRSPMEFGIFPQDANLLRYMLDSGNVRIAIVEGRLVVRSATDTAVIPTTECQYYPREVAAGTAAALIDVPEMRTILAALTPIASSKEASPVRMEMVDGGIVVSASSPVGSLEKKFSTKTIRKGKFGVSYQLLQDLIAKLRDARAKLSVFDEEGSIVRIQIECENVIYAAITSDE